MENIIKTEEETSPNLSIVNKEFITARQANRKPLREWGYEQAGLNRGCNLALECHLRWIKEGHLIDESTSLDDEMSRKKGIEMGITNKEKEQSDKKNDIRHINDVVIPDRTNQMKRYKDAIEEKKVKLSEGTIATSYNGARFWLYSILCVFISIYLLFFYASVINASFFRSMEQMVNNNGSEDLTLMLNSIFDVNSIVSFGPQSIFTYLGAFIFFGFGILPHIFYHQKSKYRAIKLIFAVLFCFLIDSLLAYKIDSGIHELKTMMGVTDNDWVWYKSVNFYLVLAFGFGTYMLWGFIYEAVLNENSKKDVNVKTEIEIKGLKKRIREVENEVIQLKKNISEMQKQIDVINLEITKLKKDLDLAQLKPEELLRNMENFYAGWLGFLNGSLERNLEKQNCESVYKRFHQSLKEQLN